MSERADRTRARPAGSRWIKIAWVFLGLAAVAVAVLALAGGGDGDGGSAAAASLQSYEVSNRTMLPTYAAGAKVDVNQEAYAAAGPEVGDVVVFHPPGGLKKAALCGAQPRAGEPCPRPVSSEANRIVRARRGGAGRHGRDRGWSRGRQR